MLEYIPVPGQMDEAVKELDPTLQFVWMPTTERKALRVMDHENPTYNDQNGSVLGCFGVVKMVSQCCACIHDDNVVFYSAMAPYLQYKFDGQGGESLVPGQWFRDAMVETDLCRHGVERHRNSDDISEKQVEAQQRARDSFAHERAHDDILFNTFRKASEELGFAHDKDEVMDLEREAARLSEDRAKRDLEDRKEARMLYHRSDEDLF